MNRHTSAAFRQFQAVCHSIQMIWFQIMIYRHGCKYFPASGRITSFRIMHPFVHQIGLCHEIIFCPCLINLQKPPAMGAIQIMLD